MTIAGDDIVVAGTTSATRFAWDGEEFAFVSDFLGVGGMGEVYRALDTRLDRRVALKVLPDHFATDETIRARFEREAKTIAQLSHPNILDIHDFGEEDGIAFAVTFETTLFQQPGGTGLLFMAVAVGEQGQVFVTTL